MHPDHKSELKRRVFQAAEAALSRQQYVSAIDVLCAMGLLARTQVASWRKRANRFPGAGHPGEPQEDFTVDVDVPPVGSSKRASSQ